VHNLFQITDIYVADDEMQHHSDDVPAEERLAKFNPNGLTSVFP